MDFAANRKKLIESIPNNSVVLVLGNTPMLRNGDNHHVFRQHSHFYYLTGLVEPNLALLIEKKDNVRTTVFAPEISDHERTWQGLSIDPSGAQLKTSADQAFSIDLLTTKVMAAIESADAVYMPFCSRTLAYLEFMDERFMTRRAPKIGVQPLHPIIGALRKFKSQEEIEIMRASAQIASRAHELAMQYAEPDIVEHSITGLVEGEFLSEGGYPAYPTICASGKNALILHYHKNNRVMQDGDLLLLDAGCELDYYASDITRTFPVNGKFTQAQKSVYSAVLKAQKEAIGQLPGSTMSSINAVVARSLTESLCELGLLKGELDKLVEQKAYQRFYMHSFGHHLGLDVHDTVAHDSEEKLSAGMVLTVEPGLYIPDDADIPAAYRGIGVRIEDNVLITANGVDILSTAPKEVDEVEELCQSQPQL